MKKLCSVIMLLSMLSAHAYVDKGIPYTGFFHSFTGYSLQDLWNDVHHDENVKKAFEERNYEKLCSIFRDTDILVQPALLWKALERNDQELLELIRAKKIDFKQFCNQLKKSGADVLGIAFKHKSYQVAAFLIKNGFREDFLERSNDYLKISLNENDHDLLAFIVKNEIEYRPNGAHILINDIIGLDTTQDFEAIQHLIDGEFVLKINNEGDTLLHTATRTMHKSAVNYLLTKEHETLQANNKGETVASLAHDNLHWCYAHDFNLETEKLFEEKCKDAHEIIMLLKQAALKTHKINIEKCMESIKEEFRKKQEALKNGQLEELKSIENTIEKLENEYKNLKKEYETQLQKCGNEQDYQLKRLEELHKAVDEKTQATIN